MGRFGSLEKESQIEQCLRTQADVGVYKWFKATEYSDITGAKFYQTELNKLARQYGSSPAPIEIVRETWRTDYPRAIAYVCNGLKIGHIPTDIVEAWHKTFELTNDLNARLVGRATFSLWKTENIILAKPVIQVPR